MDFAIRRRFTWCEITADEKLGELFVAVRQTTNFGLAAQKKKQKNILCLYLIKSTNKKNDSQYWEMVKETLNVDVIHDVYFNVSRD